MASSAYAVSAAHETATSLNSHISKLEGENRRLLSAARDSSETEAALRERVKELNCLYGIAQLVEYHGSAFEPLLQGIVDLLPPSWQYTEVCCARMMLHDRQYATFGFRESAWKQAAEIVSGGEAVGAVEVYYYEKRPDLDEGPFLHEERALIDAVAERVGKIVERIETQRRLHDALKQLQVERTALKQANAALHGVLARIEDEKKDVQNAILANVDKVLLPILHAMETELPAPQQKYVALLQENLEEITSPFADKLSKAFMKLTTVEIRICDMIRRGQTTKEVAKIRNVSPATVARQRERIRKKLGIARTDTNLTTFLTTFLPEYAERG